MRRPLLGAFSVLTFLLPSAAVAHQQLLSAAPAEGASLVRVPGAIRLTFNESVELALARLRLVGADGEVALAPIEVPPDAPQVLVTRITGALVAGTYTVHWLVTGADGHPVRGEYSFTIEPGAAGLASESSVAPLSVSPEVGPTAPGQEAPPAEHHISAEDAVFDSESLWSSAYGQTLLLKLAALSGLFATGAYNWLRAQPALKKSGDVRPLTRTAGTELAMGLLVLAVTAVLVATPPPSQDGSIAGRAESEPMTRAGSH